MDYTLSFLHYSTNSRQSKGYQMGMEICLIFELEISPTNFEWRGTKHFCP